MGVVYRAEDLRLRRRVALKLLRASLADDDSYRERFLRESRLAASIEHAAIVPIYEAGETDGLLYIAMRFVDGVDLAELLRREGPLEPERAVALVGQLASALDAAHARGLIHRDVKPSNALIGTDGDGEHAYLVDFGITQDTTVAGAADRHRPAGRDARLPRTGAHPRGAGRRPGRHLRARLRAVRVPDRAGAVPARLRGVGDLRAPRGAAPARERPAAGAAQGAGRRRSPARWPRTGPTAGRAAPSCGPPPSGRSRPGRPRAPALPLRGRARRRRARRPRGRRGRGAAARRRRRHRAGRHRREHGRADRRRRRRDQGPVQRRARPERDRRRRRLGVGRQPAGRNRLAGHPRAAGRWCRSRSGASRPDSRSAPGRCGSRTGRAASSPSSTRSRTRSCSSTTSATPRRGRRRLRCGLGRLRGRRHRRAGRPEERQGLEADRGRRAPVGAGGRGRGDLGRERGRGERHAAGPPLGDAAGQRPGGQRTERHRGRHRRGLGDQPARRDRDPDRPRHRQGGRPRAGRRRAARGRRRPATASGWRTTGTRP